MNYRQRLRIAVFCSLLLHIFILSPVWSYVNRSGAGYEKESHPLVLRLNLDSEPNRLIDTRMPAEEAPEDTDLISDQNSRAADEALKDGEKAGPQTEQPDTFDELAVPEAQPEEEPRPSENMPSPSRETAPPETAPVAAPEAQADNAVEITPPMPPGESREAEEAPMDRFKMARLNDAAPMPEVTRAGNTRDYDAVQREGPTNFEAIESDMAPYLMEIRKRVERRWNEALLIRYSGTRPVRAVIDCAITPEGKLARATIAGNPPDRVFAALCQWAVREAAPFGRFPFEVPEMYRGKNLEIRWTFTFIRNP